MFLESPSDPSRKLVNGQPIFWVMTMFSGSEGPKETPGFALVLILEPQQ